MLEKHCSSNFLLLRGERGWMQQSLTRRIVSFSTRSRTWTFYPLHPPTPLVFFGDSSFFLAVLVCRSRGRGRGVSQYSPSSKEKEEMQSMRGAFPRGIHWMHCLVASPEWISWVHLLCASLACIPGVLWVHPLGAFFWVHNFGCTTWVHP